ncbi:Dabb family protein [Martelella endophytica]|uniref:Stress responsive protein n=1 Tax=Martelella endophytica TaxID=1486262 RepID=A0A0D5LT17_MAREN|nr:Dabb family protein [Martelella endophytica]AJY47236.1 stress responsive protein [Martelella endophytica]
MIRHIVFFSVPKGGDPDAVEAGLSMLTENPHATVLEIGRNTRTDLYDEGVDFVVYGEFEDEAALSAYREHPIYKKSTSVVKPLREMRMAADYDVDKALRHSRYKG